MLCSAVMQAIEFVQMQRDDELWELLISLSLESPALTGHNPPAWPVLPCPNNACSRSAERFAALHFALYPALLALFLPCLPLSCLACLPLCPAYPVLCWLLCLAVACSLQQRSGLLCLKRLDTNRLTQPLLLKCH